MVRSYMEKPKQLYYHTKSSNDNNNNNFNVLNTTEDLSNLFETYDGVFMYSSTQQQDSHCE